MWVDLLIVAFAISALYRGREIGFVRQLFSTLGFFGGLFLGALLQPYALQLAHTPLQRSLLTVLTTLGCAIALLAVGEYAGLRLKHVVLLKRINAVDIWLGAALSVVSLLFSVWLIAAIVTGLSLPGLQADLQGSRIVSSLNRLLPQAPRVIADIGHLIDPNGFPEVFTGHEPTPNGQVALPDLGNLQNAVNQTKNSVVKIEGQGCGGVVEGSGFVVGDNLVATNAHVIAGIKHPYVQDSNGTHGATPIWFDPNLDFAVLRVSNLAGDSLDISGSNVKAGTPAVVVGYPGGGSFTASPAAVLDQFAATGRNIYGNGSADRQVYELQADIRPGNSGGPLIDQNGTVIGVIFAESTSYEHVGYALTGPEINNELDHAVANGQAVSTDRCAE